MDAMARGDVDAVVSLLAKDAVWSMPPLGSWYRGPDEIAVFLATAPLNGELALAPPARPRQRPGGDRLLRLPPEAMRRYRAFALDVLTLRGDRIADITSFINPSIVGRAVRLGGGDVLHWPHYPYDPAPGRRVLRGLRAARAPGLTLRRHGRAGRGPRARGTRAPSSRRPRRSAARAIVSCESPPSSWATSATRWRSGSALELADEVAQVVGAHDLLVRVGAGVAAARAAWTSRSVVRTGRRRTSSARLRTIVNSHGLSAISRSVGAQGGQGAHERVLDDLLGVVVRAAQHLAGVADRAAARSASWIASKARSSPAAHEVDELLVGGGAVGGRVQEDRHGCRFGPARPSLPATRGHTCPPEVGHSSPWVALTVQMPSPLQAHAATPAELRERIEAERRGRPVPRPARRRRRAAHASTSPRCSALSIGRGTGNELACRGTRRSRACTPSSRRSPASGRSATTACRATAPSSTARASPAAAPARRRRPARRAQTSIAFRRPESRTRGRRRSPASG